MIRIFTRLTMLIVAGAYALSMFLPVIDMPTQFRAAFSRDESTPKSLTKSLSDVADRVAVGEDGDGILRGHDCARFVARLIYDEDLSLFVDRQDAAKMRRIYWMNVANPAMLLGLLLYLAGAARVAQLLFYLATASASYWLFDDMDLGESLDIGYWVWIGSMAAAAVVGFLTPNKK